MRSTMDPFLAIYFYQSISTILDATDFLQISIEIFNLYQDRWRQKHKVLDAYSFNMIVIIDW